MERMVRCDRCDRRGSVGCLDFVFAKRGYPTKEPARQRLAEPCARGSMGGSRQVSGSGEIWAIAWDDLAGVLRQFGFPCSPAGEYPPKEQRGKGSRNHVPEAAWENRGRLPVIGRRGDQGDCLERCGVGIGRVWRGLGWPDWIWLGRAVWQIRQRSEILAGVFLLKSRFQRCTWKMVPKSA